MAKFVATANNAFQVLHDAGVIADDPANVRRCVIDLQAGHAAMVYVETFADDAILDALVHAGLEVTAT